MVLHERVKVIVEYSGLSIPQFAKLVGFKTPQAVRELLKGNTKTLSYEASEKILAAFPDISRDWLLTGDGEMLLANKGNQATADNGGIALAGNNNVTGNIGGGEVSVLQARVALLERLLEEKERTIQILLNSGRQ